MALPTPQNSALAAAQQVRGFMGDFIDLHNRVKAFKDKDAVINCIATLNACPTFAWNADGSPGAADGTPDHAHPIATGGLNMAADDVLGGLYMLADFLAFMTDGTVPQVDRVAVADKLITFGFPAQ